MSKADRSRIKTRAEIDEKYKWDLSTIYKDETDWQKDFDSILNETEDITSFKGKLHDAIELGKFFPKYVALGIKKERVAAYAELKFWEDMSNEHFGKLKQEVRQLESDCNIKTVFVEKELSSLTDIKTLIENNPRLKPYEYFLRNHARIQPHTLSEKEEELLAQLGIVLQKPEETFQLLNNGIVFPKIRNSNGEEIQLSHSLHGALSRNPDRHIRKLNHGAYHQPYNQFKDTIASIYATHLLADTKIAKIRNYKSSLEMHLFPDNIGVEVYKTLLKVVEESKNMISRYNRLIIKELNLDKLQPYDITVPIAEDIGKTWTYEEAVDIGRKALSPLGEDYINLYDSIFDERRIDVMESKGKLSGGVSPRVYAAGSYVLANFDRTLNGMIAHLAHEPGHFINTTKSISAQPFLYYKNPLFLVEVASTVHECLVYDYLIKHAENKKEKKYYISNFITRIYGMFFYPAMLADFELRAHEMAERGEPLTSKTLTDMYRDVLRKHRGDEIVIDENIDRRWMTLPQLYTDFYLFKYSTALCAAVILSQKIMYGNKDDVDRYDNFLRAGCHKDPLDILKDAGIDMNDPETFRAPIRFFEDLINQYESLK